MVNAETLGFGIEIEGLAPTALVQSGELQIGMYHHGIQVPFLPDGWKAERDGSIDNSAGGEQCEIVSPILRGRDGLEQVAKVMQILDAKGFKVNRSTSVHVHVSWPRDLPSDALARLITIVAYLEKGLYAITGTKSRETGRFCRSIRKHGDATAAKRASDADRYHILNLTNLARGTREAVEFRAFSGTTSGLKVTTWICACLGIVQRAINAKRSPTWNPKPLTGGWKKSGDGQSEAERLMGYLAWGEGYARLNGGTSYGWIDAGFSMDEAKKEMRRLAAKYDAQA